MRTYVFACIHNAGRSQMSAAFFNQLADPTKAHAISAGTQPAQYVHPVVVEVMREAGIDLSHAHPQKLTAELAQGAEMLITMGCGDECPLVLARQRLDWGIPDPRDMTPEEFRGVRNLIEAKVKELIERL